MIARSPTALARPPVPLAETGLPGRAAAPRVRPGGPGRICRWRKGCVGRIFKAVAAGLAAPVEQQLDKAA